MIARRAGRFGFFGSLAALLLSPLVWAEDAETVQGADLELLAIVREIGERVEVLRAQPFKTLPIALRATPESQQAVRQQRMADYLDEARLDARGRAWADVGLGQSRTPKQVLQALIQDLDGIALDGESDGLLVAPERLPAGSLTAFQATTDESTLMLETGVHPEEPVLAHMLIHLLQAERPGSLDQGLTDRMLTRVAWAEGEANVLAIQYLFGKMGLADAVFSDTVGPGDYLDGKLVPAGFDLPATSTADLLVRFVYDEGFAQAFTVFRAGGWLELGREMARRQTTRDLLHPEAPALATVEFGAPQPPTEGLKLADTDSLGEQGIITLVSRLTGKDNLALQAGDGWAADRLYRWENSGSGVTEWDTRWISKEEARDFEYGLGRALQARRRVRGPLEYGEGPWEVDAEGRRFRVEVQGSQVRVLITTAPVSTSSDAPSTPGAQ